jgi:predicted dehydrogenase
MVELAGVVSTNYNRYEWVMTTCGLRKDQLYEDLETALDAINPDILVNITPPLVHLSTSLAALKKGIAVVCEKPIALSRKDAQALINASEEYKKSVYIAENYRFFDVMRKAKSLLQKGVIGTIQSVGIDFYRDHHVIGTTNYHMELEHPLLMDVSIHHFDLLRFLTSSDAKKIYADVWCPPNSHYSRNSNTNVQITMSNDIKATYRGHLASYQTETLWPGNWRLEGDLGIMKIIGNNIIVNGRENQEYKAEDRDDSDRELLLDIFRSLEQGTQAQSEIHDNLRTLDMVFAAIDSAQNGQVVNLPLYSYNES